MFGLWACHMFGQFACTCDGPQSDGIWFHYISLILFRVVLFVPGYSWGYCWKLWGENPHESYVQDCSLRPIAFRKAVWHSLTRCRTFSYGFISYMDDKIRVPTLKAENALRDISDIFRPSDWLWIKRDLLCWQVMRTSLTGRSVYIFQRIDAEADPEAEYSWENSDLKSFCALKDKLQKDNKEDVLYHLRTYEGVASRCPQSRLIELPGGPCLSTEQPGNMRSSLNLSRIPTVCKSLVLCKRLQVCTVGLLHRKSSNLYQIAQVRIDETYSTRNWWSMSPRQDLMHVTN